VRGLGAIFETGIDLRANLGPRINYFMSEALKAVGLDRLVGWLLAVECSNMAVERDISEMDFNAILSDINLFVMLICS